MKNKYAVISGEGDDGTIDEITVTLIGLKRKLTAERCGGDRWAWAVAIPEGMDAYEAIDAGRMGQLETVGK